MSGRPAGPTCSFTRRTPTTAKTVDSSLVARLREEFERTKDDPYPEGARPKRPNRSQVYSVRLSAEEQARVQSVADARHLPGGRVLDPVLYDDVPFLYDNVELPSR